MLPMDFKRDIASILITCPKGLARYLENEVSDLKMNIVRSLPSAVLTTGTMFDCMKLNLTLFTAHHVLYKVLECVARTPDEMYAAIKSLPWEKIIPLNEILCITSTVKTPSIKDTRFANLRCKDAIVDRLAEKTGKRCNSGPSREGVVVHLYWQDERCMVYLDTSGETLSRRGYRKNPGEAPMQETLAAGVLRATGWLGKKDHFVNPMCGSGTLAIEAALFSLRRNAGMLRTNFGFMHYTPFVQDDLAIVKNDYKSREASKLDHAIIATDINPMALSAARENSRHAGVEAYIDFKQCDIADTPTPQGKGIVIVNPEYGIRMGSAEELQAVYKRIGDFFKQKCSGYNGFVFTGNFDLIKKIGLKSKRRIQFLSAKLECKLYEYELYTGSR